MNTLRSQSPFSLAQRPESANGSTTPSPLEIGPTERRRISSRELLGGSSDIEIDHAGSTYRLRVTSLGKLILTK